MHPLFQKTLKGYQPLGLRGQLLDGSFGRPKFGAGDTSSRGSSPTSASRLMLAALAGLQHTLSPQRSNKS